MTYLGYGNIPEIIYGINGSLNWKNFDFSFLMQGAANAQVYLKGGIILPYFNQGNLPQFWVNEAWTEETPATAIRDLLNRYTISRQQMYQVYKLTFIMHHIYV